MSELTLKMLKAQAWEEAKGKLRAVAVLAGHKRLFQLTRAGEEEASARWADLDRRVNAFIKEIEDDGLQE